MNHFKIPKGLPFWFVKNGDKGVHFDSKWACEQVKSFQRKVVYRQKWAKADTTPLQIESSLPPSNLQVRNFQNGVVKSFPWVAVINAVSYKIYQTTFDVSDVADGEYYLYQKVTFGDLIWEAIAEPFSLKTSHLNTLMFRYKNSFNKDDIAWTTGLEMKFRIEASIDEWEPNTERTEYVNQTKDEDLLDAVPGDVFQLNIGDTNYNVSGVWRYLVKILDIIFCCDFVSISEVPNVSEKQYKNKSGSAFKLTSVKTYPLVGAALDIVPSKNLQSLEFSDTTPLPIGIVTAYDIETSFFGPAATVPVTEVEENG